MVFLPLALFIIISSCSPSRGQFLVQTILQDSSLLGSNYQIISLCYTDNILLWLLIIQVYVFYWNMRDLISEKLFEAKKENSKIYLLPLKCFGAAEESGWNLFVDGKNVGGFCNVFCKFLGPIAILSAGVFFVHFVCSVRSFWIQ